MDSSLDDGALLAAAASSDEEAWRLLIRRHVRAATLFAVQLTGDRDEAEDIVQAAFVLVFERAGSLDGSRPFAPWLFGVVRRLASKAHARRARRRRLWLRWAGDANPAARTADEPEASSDLDFVRRQLAALPPMQRACFELVALRDVAVVDVAAMYEIDASTVRQHVFRARRALRAVVEPVLGSRGRRWTDDGSVG